MMKIKRRLNTELTKLVRSWCHLRLGKQKSGIYGLRGVLHVSQLASPKETLVRKFYGRIEDPEAMRRFGAGDVEDYSFWAWRACGVACVKMVIDACRPEQKVSLRELIARALGMGGYEFAGDKGWKHKSLVELAFDYGLRGGSERFVSAERVVWHLSRKRAFVCGVDSSTGGHLVLIHGFEVGSDRKLEGFYYHDPYDFRRPGSDLFMEIAKFRKVNTGRGFWLKGE